MCPSILLCSPTRCNHPLQISPLTRKTHEKRNAKQCNCNRIIHSQAGHVRLNNPRHDVRRVRCADLRHAHGYDRCGVYGWRGDGQLFEEDVGEGDLTSGNEEGAADSLADWRYVN